VLKALSSSGTFWMLATAHSRRSTSMKLYAERPLRRATQLAADLFAIILTVLAVRLGVTAHTQVMELRAPGDGLVDAGSCR
jgi:hypothetical protein